MLAIGRNHKNLEVKSRHGASKALPEIGSDLAISPWGIHGMGDFPMIFFARFDARNPIFAKKCRICHIPSHTSQECTARLEIYQQEASLVVDVLSLSVAS